MKKESLDRTCRLFSWMLTALILLCGLLLIVFCVRIGLSGDAPYTRERVVAALGYLVLPIGLTAIVALATAILCRKKTGIARGSKPTKEPHMSPRKERVLHATVLVAALCMIVLGVFNGSMRDVMEKAVRICTECIGLG